MLDLAQDEIGRGEVFHRAARHLAVGAEFGEHFERARAAQVRPLAAENQLLGLDEKLDLANAAASELDVVARNSDLGVAAHGMDLPLHRVDVGKRRIIEIFAPDEGRQRLEKRAAKRDVARRRTRLDIGRALPVLAKHFVIAVGRGKGDRDRRRAWIWPQPQIDPQHIGIAGALLQQFDEALGQAHEQAGGIGDAGDGRRFRIVENRKIDIARIIELESAKLAERENGQAATGLGLAERGELQIAGAMRLPQQKAQGGLDEGVGGG